MNTSARARPRLPFTLFIALRFLREGRMQTLLILFGIAAGVAVIIFLSQLISRLEGVMIDRVLGSQAHIVVRPLEDANLRALPADAGTAIVEPRTQRLRAVDQWESVVRLAQSRPDVLAVSPVVSGPAFALRGRANKAVALLGVDPARYTRIVRMEQYMRHGRFEVSGTTAVIGVELARELGARVGDKIFVRTSAGRDEMLQIGGLFDIGNKDLNRRWVFTGIKLAQTLLDLPGGVSNVDITVHDIFQAQAVAARLQAATGLLAESWMDTNTQLLSALRSQASSNTMIRSFVILIVALGIASVLVVSVVQKRKEIGILRAMGAGARQIMAVFMLQGALLGLAGALLGIAGAALLFALFRLMARGNPDSLFGTLFLSPQVALAAAGMALVVGLLAATLPARRAARLDPVQAIRA